MTIGCFRLAKHKQVIDFAVSLHIHGLALERSHMTRIYHIQPSNTTHSSFSGTTTLNNAQFQSSLALAQTI